MKYVLLAVAFAVAASGCGPVDYDKADYLHAIAHMRDADGYAVVDFNVREYTITMTFNDGGSITDGYDISDYFSDNTGTIEFTSADNGLAVAYGGTDCYDTCVDYDEYGYCWQYVRDCYDSTYTTTYDVSDIYATGTQVVFSLGSSNIVTQGTYDNSFLESETTFQQEDTFYLPFYTTADGTKAMSPKAKAGKAFQANYAPKKIRGEAILTLTPAQKALVLKARAHIMDKKTGKALPASAFKVQL